MMKLPAILAAVNAGSNPVVLATRLRGSSPGERSLAHGLPAEDLLASGASRLGQWQGTEVLLERLMPRKLPPWLNFCSQILDKGRTCVLATVGQVQGELPYALGDHFAYDERNHGLLPMDARLSLDLQRACEEVRTTARAAWVSLEVPGGRLDLLLEPLAPMGVPTVILAAGASRRLGSPKQLVELAGESLLRRIARTALAGGGPVTVVVGFRAPEMQANLAGLPVRVTVNPEWEEGMASSLRAGVADLPPGSTGVLLLLCDQPGVDEALLARLQALHRDQPLAVVACEYGGTQGTPALFPARTFEALLALRGDRGARALLKGEAVVGVPFAAGALDVDVPGDLLSETFRPNPEATQGCR